MVVKDKLYWDYRVIKRVVDGEDTFGIYEVFYDENDLPFICTEKSCAPYGDDFMELKEDVRWMMDALSMPVLDYDMFDR